MLRLSFWEKTPHPTPPSVIKPSICKELNRTAIDRIVPRILFRDARTEVSVKTEFQRDVVRIFVREVQKINDRGVANVITRPLRGF